MRKGCQSMPQYGKFVDHRKFLQDVFEREVSPRIYWQTILLVAFTTLVLL